MQTPDEWLADFERKVADLQQKATEFKRDLEAAGRTETSPDKTVTVTVAPSGALLDLTIADEAMSQPGKALAEQILAVTRKARQAAASEVAQAFVPLGGDAGTVQRIPTPEPVEDAQPQQPQPQRPAQKRYLDPLDDETESHVFDNKQQW